MMISNVLKDAKAKLHHLQTPGLDASILLAHVLSINNPQQLALMGSNKLSDKQIQEFNGLIERRIKLEPVALITGYKEFWSLDFKVTADTLIPRPETELIIESVLRLFPNGGYNILDLGTGSGCLIVTLLHEYGSSHGIAVDLSDKALDVAKHNAIKHDVIGRVGLIQSDWLDNIPAQKFDIIVSNPPYISLDEMAGLQANVTEFEPHTALTDFADGLAHYRSIFNYLHKYTHPETICFIEHGMNQGDSIAMLLEKHNYSVLQRKKDLAGIERCIIFKPGNID